MVEITIQNAFIKQAAKLGVWAMPFKHRGRRDAPDVLVLCPCGSAFFIEFKEKYRTPRRGQFDFARQLRRQGFSIFFCDSLDQAMTILRAYV